MNKDDKILLPIFKALHSVRDKLGDEMVEKIRDMLAGYLFYKEGTEIMSNTMAKREGITDCYFPEKEEK